MRAIMLVTAAPAPKAPWVTAVTRRSPFVRHGQSLVTSVVPEW
jgi:hypothetical protein